MVVHAQNETAQDSIDAALMAYAREHSDAQAVFQTSTIVNPADVVNGILSDFGHKTFLADYSPGQIGAGVAFSDNGQAYYTVDGRYGEGVDNGMSLEETSSDPSLAQVVLETVIPNPDGSIVHTVIEGDTLWSIATAYGVTINDILNLNGIADENAIINIGEKLIIRAAQVTATPPAPEETETVALNAGLNQTIFPTAKPAAVQTDRPIATATPTPSDSEPESTGPKITGWLIIYSFTFFTIIVQAIFNLIKTNRR